MDGGRVGRFNFIDRECDYTGTRAELFAAAGAAMYNIVNENITL
jgi:hypothetical protein